MLTLNIGIVVVRKADIPTISGLCSLMAAMNFSGPAWTPISITLNPAPSNIIFTRFLPMSCTSPLTVPIRKVPTVSAPVRASRGRRTLSAPDIAFPEMSISGTKKSPRSNRAPTSSREGINASKRIALGVIPSAIPNSVKRSTSGAFPTRVSSNSAFRISSCVMLHLPSRASFGFGAKLLLR